MHTLSDVYKEWQHILKHIERLSRYTLGTKIDLLFCDVLELILLASYTNKERKLSLLEQASAKFDALKFFLQLAWEMKYIDHQSYDQMSVPLTSVGKQIGTWMKSMKTKAPDSPEASETLF